MGQRILGLNINGWRQPKGGRWLVDNRELRPDTPMPMSVVGWSLAALVSVIVALLVPHSIFYLPVLFGLVQTPPFLGTVADDHPGDSLRVGGQKIDSMWNSVYDGVYFANWFAYTGTTEQKITTCVADAKAAGIKF